MFRRGSFSGSEGDVVPRVGSEKRVRLRDADADEEPEGGRGGQALPDILQFAADMPKVSEVDVNGIGVPPDQNAQ